MPKGIVLSDVHRAVNRDGTYVVRETRRLDDWAEPVRHFAYPSDARLTARFTADGRMVGTWRFSNVLAGVPCDTGDVTFEARPPAS